jgi:uncharacterized membrane protein
MNQTLSVFSSVLTILLAAMVAAFFCLLPEWTHRGMLFAVNVPADFRKTREGRRILRDYRLQACAHALMSFALIYVGAFTGHLTFLLLGIFWLPAGYFLIFQWARDRVEPHAVFRSAVFGAALETQNPQPPAGWMPHLGPFAILGATALFLHSRFQRIPLRFPIRGRFRGMPSGFGFPTREGIYGPLILAGVICALLWLLSYNVQRRAERAQRVPSSGRKRAREFESLNRTLSVMLGSEYLLAVICSAAGGLLPFLGFWVMLPLGALAMVAVAALFLLAVESPEEAME